MDIDKIDWGNFFKNEKKKGRFRAVFSDPHLYLMLVILGMMAVMTLVSCAHSGKFPERSERNFEPGYMHK